MANKRVTDTGRQYLLDCALGTHTPTVDVDYHLFATDITPTEDDVDATYTGNEASFPGYASVHVVGWSASLAVGEGRVATATPVSFMVTGPSIAGENCYGYYATKHGTTQVVWAMRFDGAPIVLNEAGMSITITPSLSLFSQFT